MSTAGFPAFYDLYQRVTKGFSQKNMMVLLQNTVTSLYLCQGPENWTTRFRQAHDFGRIQAALDKVQGDAMSDIQVVLVLQREGTLEFMPLQIEPLIRSREIGMIEEVESEHRKQPHLRG